VKVLSRVFRGKLIAGLKRAFSKGELSFPGTLKHLAQPRTFAAFVRLFFRRDWVVYCKPPFAGPEHVLKYLGSYTHRVAISNHRLLDVQQDQVTFRWRDSAYGNKQRKLTIAITEFLRRFCLHVLPHSFVRIRHYGFLANRRRARILVLCRQLLKTTSPLRADNIGSIDRCPAFCWKCPCCGGVMMIMQRLDGVPPVLRSPPLTMNQPA
jgi:hypothetical protein